ncbi:DUF6644 family protein [Sphingobium lignivorans]|uniref:DUF6644 domain-containing protein n=1 Tax=Sphingobium lignivorans TaxID=2735886 RepID=A0ABR6NCJ2_9SPHN|nr:DUF6644 family protein [Sphingobium lignivorans]MBB5984987.1 hypothetical protein [Sphingobium lignivorans]
MIETLLEAIGNSAIGTYVAEDPLAFPWIETAHVISLAILFGSILVVDLRLMGLASRDYPIRSLGRSILPITWIAFIGAVVTGGLLFASNPYGYFGNTAFRAKMILLVLAGVNMAVFHLVVQRGSRLDRRGPPPGSARLAGLLSMAIWIAVIACGRWIGFTMSPF